MNLKPENQLSLFGHHVILLNFINLYKNNKLPNKILYYQVKKELENLL